MRINFLAGFTGIALILCPAGVAQQKANKPRPPESMQNSDGVQRAIAFQRAKDRADQRQAQLEARHPSIDFSSADRRMTEPQDGHSVSDPGEAQWKKHKK